MESITVRVCKSCAVAFPATREFFYGSAKGLHTRCKGCYRALMVQKYRDNPAPMLAQKKAKYAANPEPAKAQANSRYAEKKTEVLAQHKTPQAKAKRSVRNKIRYWADPAKPRKYAREWRKKNPELARIQSRRNRVRRHAAPGSHTKAHVKLQYAQQKGKCYWCQANLNGEYQVDHIIALAKGGTDYPANICCACVDCNRRKSAKAPWDFAGRLL